MTRHVEEPESSKHPMVGVFWMFVTGLCFVAVTALVKYLGDRIPPAESAFLRYLLGLVFLIPMIGSLRKTTLTPKLWLLFAGRGVVHSGGVMLWFFCHDPDPLGRGDGNELPVADLCDPGGGRIFG